MLIPCSWSSGAFFRCGRTRTKHVGLFGGLKELAGLYYYSCSGALFPILSMHWTGIKGGQDALGFLVATVHETLCMRGKHCIVHPAAMG